MRVHLNRVRMSLQHCFDIAYRYAKPSAVYGARKMFALTANYRPARVLRLFRGIAAKHHETGPDGSAVNPELLFFSYVKKNIYQAMKSITYNIRRWACC
ncbi:hypothetical protein NX784_00250 [Massilia pinisoli]|uniref:Uncharacterized protein n=1 Tax=Massilia pinisoli TaxID=1772194 RepID=A0ABT1ZJD4_9BURK|nr:hypothetical protein [Massilia pinisoli]MCS0580012.1 hypothetical protein [Massilia pinisoli]